jgi:hypothetical protein
MTERVGQADVISLVDVIEHIPLEHHERLLANIAGVGRPGCRLVLTYPSPQYQLHLRENAPAELQIVDEIVQIQELAQKASQFGFSLRHFSLEDVWLQNQYVHAVFQRDLSCAPNPTPRMGPLGRAKDVVSRGAHSLFLRRYRKWKYRDRVFACGAHGQKQQ